LREALRALYLGLLVYLHRARLIHYHPALTNWQYVRRYAGGERGQSLLRQLTQVFDEKWYGHLACRREEYEAFAQGVQTLIGETSA
jgi:hypothetical protein